LERTRGRPKGDHLHASVDGGPYRTRLEHGTQMIYQLTAVQSELALGRIDVRMEPAATGRRLIPLTECIGHD